jgi:hypothetical protein
MIDGAPLGRKVEFEIANAAMKDVARSSAGDWQKGGTRFVRNPTTGALEVPAHLREKVISALRQEAYRIALGCQRRSASLYLRKFGLDCRKAILEFARDLHRFLFQYTGN